MENFANFFLKLVNFSCLGSRDQNIFGWKENLMILNSENESLLRVHKSDTSGTSEHFSPNQESQAIGRAITFSFRRIIRFSIG